MSFEQIVPTKPRRKAKGVRILFSGQQAAISIALKVFDGLGKPDRVAIYHDRGAGLIKMIPEDGIGTYKVQFRKKSATPRVSVPRKHFSDSLDGGYECAFEIVGEGSDIALLVAYETYMQSGLRSPQLSEAALERNTRKMQ